MLAQCQHAEQIGADDGRFHAAGLDQGTADLFAVDIRLERRAKEDLLGAVRLDRSGAMKFQRPAAGVQQQITAEQAMLVVPNDSQETQRRWRPGVASAHDVNLRLARLAPDVRTRFVIKVESGGCQGPVPDRIGCWWLPALAAKEDG